MAWLNNLFQNKTAEEVRLEETGAEEQEVPATQEPTRGEAIDAIIGAEDLSAAVQIYLKSKGLEDEDVALETFELPVVVEPIENEIEQVISLIPHYELTEMLNRYQVEFLEACEQTDEDVVRAAAREVPSTYVLLEPQNAATLVLMEFVPNSFDDREHGQYRMVASLNDQERELVTPRLRKMNTDSVANEYDEVVDVPSFIFDGALYAKCKDDIWRTVLRSEDEDTLARFQRRFDKAKKK